MNSDPPEPHRAVQKVTLRQTEDHAAKAQKVVVQKVVVQKVVVQKVVVQKVVVQKVVVQRVAIKVHHRQHHRMIPIALSNMQWSSMPTTTANSAAMNC